MPTPLANDYQQGGTTQGNRKSPNLSIAVHHVSPPLLPTPAAADGNGGGRMGSEGHAMPLPGAVKTLVSVLTIPGNRSSSDLAPDLVACPPED
jgi:DNA (cytosine-5)-methyltransferase 1